MGKLKAALYPVLFGVLGLVLAHHETVLTGFAFTQNDLGDTRFCHYLLEHGHRWWTGHPGHQKLWDPPYFYPQTENVLAFAENMLGSVPFYSPWRLLGMAPDNALQAWILTLSSLNFLATYVLLRRGLSFSSLASSAGAALFAYAGTRINQTMHYQLFPHFFSVLAAFAAVRVFEHLARRANVESGRGEATGGELARIGWIVLFFACVSAQLWAGIYLGWYLGFSLALGGLIALTYSPWRGGLFALLRAHPYTLILAAAASGASVLPMLMRYAEVGRRFGMRPFWEALTMIPLPESWIHLGLGSWFYKWMAVLPAFQRIPMEHEQRLGFGLLTTALALAGVWLGRRRPAVLFFGLLGGALVLLSTQYGGYGRFVPWKLVYDYFPGAQAIRSVSRIGLVVLLPVGVGVAAFIDWLGARLATSRPSLALTLAPLLAAATLLEQGETTPSYDKHQNREDVSAIARAIPSHCEAFLFSPVQGYGPYWKFQLDAMMASLESGVPTLNGYSGHGPDGWPFGETNVHTALDEYRVASALQQYVQAQRLSAERICWVRVGLQQGPNRAVFVLQEVPAVMLAGQRYPVSLTVRNIGGTAWGLGQGFFLGSLAPQDNRRWGFERVALPGEVQPGGEVTFRFEVNAPPAPGRHPFQWRMVREGPRGWFGTLSERVDVEVKQALP